MNISIKMWHFLKLVKKYTNYEDLNFKEIINVNSKSKRKRTI